MLRRQFAALNLAVAMSASIVVSGSIAVATVPGDDEATTAGADTFAAKLRQVPAELVAGPGDLVTYVDVDAALVRVGAGASDDERLSGLAQTSQIGSWVLAPQFFGSSAAQIDEARAEVGFAAVDIDHEISAGSPPRTLTIADTRVAADDVVATIEADPVWSAELQEATAGDVSYWTWGDDPKAQNLALRSPFRQLGQGGALALIGDPAATTAIRSTDPEVVAASLLADAGAEESFADSTLGQSVLGAIGDGEVQQAIVVRGDNPLVPALGSQATPEQVEAALEEAVVVGPYTGVAVVELAGDGGYRTEILVVYANETDAAANVEPITTFFAEAIDLRTQRPVAEIVPGAADVSVEAVGNVVRVGLAEPDDFRVVVQMLFSRSLLPS